MEWDTYTHSETRNWRLTTMRMEIMVMLGCNVVLIDVNVSEVLTASVFTVRDNVQNIICPRFYVLLKLVNSVGLLGETPLYCHVYHGCIV
jgi:hypothetical protein